jgi:hypothetical protein
VASDASRRESAQFLRHDHGHQLDLRGRQLQAVEDAAEHVSDEGAFLFGEADAAFLTWPMEPPCIRQTRPPMRARLPQGLPSRRWAVQPGWGWPHLGQGVAVMFVTVAGRMSRWIGLEWLRWSSRSPVAF